jgi:hypothetical protein
MVASAPPPYFRTFLPYSGNQLVGLFAPLEASSLIHQPVSYFSPEADMGRPSITYVLADVHKQTDFSNYQVAIQEITRLPVCRKQT